MLAHVGPHGTEALIRHVIFYILIIAFTLAACYAAVMLDRRRTACARSHPGQQDALPPRRSP